MVSTLLKPIAPSQSIGPYRVSKPLDDRDDAYLAEEPIGRKQVIVQVLAVPPAGSDAFVNEMRQLERLQHEHIVPIVDVGEANGLCYFVCEAMKGETLEARLKREHRLPLKEAIRIAREIAAALAAMHSNGLLHRDICPAKIWLEPSGQARLTGFGSGSHDDDSLLNRLSGSGTPGYLSPEQAAGETVTPAADLFGLGCVLYQMASGDCPFHGDNSAALFRAVVFDRPKAARKINPEITEALDDLLTRLLAKMPSARPASAIEVQHRLMEMFDPTAPKPVMPPTLPEPIVFPASKRILESIAVTRNAEPIAVATVSRLGVAMSPPTPPKKRTWFPDLVAGLLLVMASAGLYLWWKASQEPPPQPPIVKPYQQK